MGLFGAKYVFTVLVESAAVIQITSLSATVEVSSFTNFTGHLLVIYVTVVTE